MVNVLGEWCWVHPGNPTTISASGNRGPTHVSRSPLHPYLTVFYWSDQSDCTLHSIANGINGYKRSEAVRFLHIGPLEDQRSGTAETWIRTNFSIHTLEHRKMITFSHYAWLMQQETGEVLVTIHERDSHEEYITHMVTVELGSGLIFDCFEILAFSLSLDSPRACAGYCRYEGVKAFRFLRRK